MSAADTTLLTRQREMLLQKLDEFERTNKALRRLLREQQATEVCTKFFFLLLQNSLPCNVNTREHFKSIWLATLLAFWFRYQERKSPSNLSLLEQSY